MSIENEHNLADDLSRLLLDVLTLSNPPEIPDHLASVPSFRTLYNNLVSLRDFLYLASNGDLSKEVSLKGFIGGTLKTLQSHLKHMTWQTKMVASGDFSQRVDFMGEFAESFNAMVIQLDRTLTELVNKKSELSQANEDLLREIDARKQTEAALRSSKEKLKRLALTDALTGLHNRRHFNKLARDMIGRALRYSHPLSVMAFDIDHFKWVNDTFGHNYGDLTLKMVAKATRELIRATDIPARYGGEEFIVLLCETPAAEAAAVAERLRNKIQETVVDSGKGPIKITASFGVSDYIEPGNTLARDRMLSEFVTTADRAMYASKNAGRNRVTIYTPEQLSTGLF
ncbi:MAG: diguanylate cyclase [Pedobacter sp.]